MAAKVVEYNMSYLIFSINNGGIWSENVIGIIIFPSGRDIYILLNFLTPFYIDSAVGLK